MRVPACALSPQSRHVPRRQRRIRAAWHPHRGPRVRAAPLRHGLLPPAHLRPPPVLRAPPLAAARRPRDGPHHPRRFRRAPRDLRGNVARAPCRPPQRQPGVQAHPTAGRPSEGRRGGVAAGEGGGARDMGIGAYFLWRHTPYLHGLFPDTRTPTLLSLLLVYSWVLGHWVMVIIIRASGHTSHSHCTYLSRITHTKYHTDYLLRSTPARAS
ncbi:hypothetical protein FB451DRAFT_1567982 [Mycena latifolia]|nr:hypothetical protein FB451DRAFT_1567982 [Mycena latifolia]